MSSPQDSGKAKTSLQKRIENLSPKERLECEKLGAEIREIEAKIATAETTASKATLEKDKLRVEISEAGRPFFKRASIYTAIAPVALGVIGFVFTWSSGWFDVQNKKLEIDKKTLDFDVKQLQIRRDDELKRLAFLEQTNGALQAFVSKLSKALADAEVENQKLSNQLFVASDSTAAREKMLKEEVGLLTGKIQDVAARLSSSTSESRESLLEEQRQYQKARADAEEQLNDLATLRSQVAKLREELNLARRLAWIRQGIFGSTNSKSAQMLMSATNGTTNFHLDVQLGPNGGATVPTNK